MIDKCALRYAPACVLSTILAMLSFGTVANADAPTALTPPLAEMVDENGVDFITGKLAIELPGVAIGNGSSGIAREGKSLSWGYADNFLGTLNTSVSGTTNYITVTLGNSSERFLNNSGVYTPVSGGVDTLSCTSTTCTFTLKDGTQAVYDKSLTSKYNMTANAGIVTQITKPDGEIINMTYRVGIDDPGMVTTRFVSLKSVTSSLGWMLKYSVTSDTYSQLTYIQALNRSVDYCDPNIEGCSSTTQPWIDATYTSVASGTFAADVSVADRLGKKVTILGYNRLANKIGGIRSDSGVTKSATYYTSGTFNGLINTISIGTSVWNYSYAVTGSLKTITVTNPDTSTRVIVVNTSLEQIVSDTDGLGRSVKYTYDTGGRLLRTINPDASYNAGVLNGGYTEYAYDTRGNTTTQTVVAKAGSGLANLVTAASYPATCTNIKICNKPTSIIDTSGVQTSYAYDPNSGEIATITRPAVGGVASQVRFTYAQQTPYLKNSSGVLVASQPVWRLTSASGCMTGSAPACVGTTDEMRVNIGYGTNNIYPTSYTIARGDNSLSQTTTYSYNVFGNVTSVDGPMPGTDDATYYFYDAVNREIGSIGPDPDGTGSLLRRASRTTYNGDGQVLIVERGTTTGTDSTALANMVVLDSQQTEFNSSNGLPIVSRYYTGTSTTPTGVSQTTYDSMLQISCITERLNPSAFSSLPVSACSLGAEGTDGPDKVTKYTYDLAGALLKSTSAFGTTVQADDLVRTYNPTSGTISTLVDGKGNKTTFTYDDFNRPLKACLPSASSGATSSTTDCEAVAYNGGRVISRTLRSGHVETLGFDAVGRVISKTGTTSEAFTYDNFDQVKTHTNNGLTETYTYNALGQLLTDVQPMGTVSYEYDAYGRRTKLIYPSNGGIPFNVTYSYYNDGNLLSENVSYNNSAPATLVQFPIDNYGRRSRIYRGVTPYPIQTAYAYDASSRIGSISNNIGGGVTNDNVMSYIYSADSKIKTSNNSNSVFDYILPSGGTTNYALNGLNQISTAGASSFGYDARGNMSSDGGVTYTYNYDNLLISTSAGATLSYDAEDRLFSISKNGVTTKFLYDGSQAIAEFDASGALQRRYVHGPGEDEPLAWYEGTDLTNLRYFTADIRGSIVSVTDSSGVSLSNNQYDEYGLPYASNLGRFQYTGQMYLPEIGLYYYKARMYSPTLGRFIQADPIGYGDGMNMYSYVHNDPINGRDPWGLADDDDKGDDDGGETTFVTVTGRRLGGALRFFSRIRARPLLHSIGNAPVEVVVVGRRRNRLFKGFYDNKCGALSGMLGKELNLPDGAYFFGINIAVIAGIGGGADGVSGILVKDHKVVESFEGVNLKVGIGLLGAAGGGASYGSSSPLYQSGDVGFNLVGAAGPVAGNVGSAGKGWANQKYNGWAAGLAKGAGGGVAGTADQTVSGCSSRN